MATLWDCLESDLRDAFAVPGYKITMTALDRFLNARCYAFNAYDPARTT